MGLVLLLDSLLLSSRPGDGGCCWWHLWWACSVSTEAREQEGAALRKLLNALMGMVAHAYSLSTWEGKIGSLWQVQGATQQDTASKKKKLIEILIEKDSGAPLRDVMLIYSNISLECL